MINKYLSIISSCIYCVAKHCHHNGMKNCCFSSTVITAVTSIVFSNMIETSLAGHNLISDIDLGMWLKHIQREFN